MDVVLCPFCTNILKNPVECNNCHNNFCEKHINDFYNCPCCNSHFSGSINYGIKKILDKFENERENKIIKMNEDIIQCTLCPFEGKPGYFCFHFAEEHKKELINEFGRKKIYQAEKEAIQLIPKEKKFEKYKSDDNITYNLNNPFENDQLNNNNFSHINSGKIENININCFTERNNKIKVQNILSKSRVTNLYYCKKINKDINCECCPEHICSEGNCLCAKCMLYNFKAFNLKYGELFNKSGRIAKLDNGEFHCGIKYDKSIQNSVGGVFHSQIQCSFFGRNFCNECKILNKYKKIYLDYISKNIFT